MEIIEVDGGLFGRTRRFCKSEVKILEARSKKVLGGYHGEQGELLETYWETVSDIIFMTKSGEILRGKLKNIKP